MAYSLAGLVSWRGWSPCLSAFAFLLVLDGTARASSLLRRDVQVSTVSDPDERRATLSQVQRDLSRFAPPGTKLAGCPVLIDYVEPMASGHDTSFGAICQISFGGKVRSITLCNDRLVGKFFQADELFAEVEKLGFFVQTYCPPGG